MTIVSLAAARLIPSHPVRPQILNDWQARFSSVLTIHGPFGRLCDTVSRRELLTVGSLSLFGLGLPTLLRQREAQAANSAKRPAHGFGAADAAILIYLQGSPSHIDSLDRPRRLVEFGQPVLSLF